MTDCNASDGDPGHGRPGHLPATDRWRLRGLCLGALLASTSAGVPAADLRGIYVYTNDVSQISSATANALTAAFQVPGVDGVALVIGWKAIEPAMGQYDWTTLDQWIGRAVSLGKKIDLVVMAGASTPPWLFPGSSSRLRAEPALRLSPSPSAPTGEQPVPASRRHSQPPGTRLSSAAGTPCYRPWPLT